MSELNPTVSIICLAYNHELFIEEAIKGFLMQDVNFPMEIIIHDDASTDNTPAIIRSYQSLHPDLIKPILQHQNQFSQEKGRVSKIVFTAAKGKFIALCEGDDFWTDPQKLQRQVDFLTNNSEYVMSTENGMLNHTDGRENKLFNEIKIAKDIGINELLSKRQFPTASVLFYRSLLDEEFFNSKFKGGDTVLWSWISVKGRIRFDPIVSSVYRRGAHGQVESTHSMAWAWQMKSWNLELQKILGNHVDEKVFRNREFKEFKFCFLQGLQKGNFDHTMTSLRECVKAKPFDSFLMVIFSPLYIAKNLITKNKKQF